MFREKKWEVIFLSDARDEYVLENLREFDGKKLTPADKADVKHDKDATGLDAETAGKLATFVKETLGERVGEVRVSQRLIGSPAVAVSTDTEMSTNMRRMMRALQRDEGLPPVPKPDLESESRADRGPGKNPPRKQRTRRAGSRATTRSIARHRRSARRPARDARADDRAAGEITD